MNPYFVAGAVIAVALAGGAGYVKGSAAGKAEVQAQWDQEKAKLALEYAAAQAAAREKEQQLKKQLISSLLATQLLANMIHAFLKTLEFLVLMAQRGNS